LNWNTGWNARWSASSCVRRRRYLRIRRRTLKKQGDDETTTLTTASSRLNQDVFEKLRQCLVDRERLTLLKELVQSDELSTKLVRKKVSLSNGFNVDWSYFKLL
jgi:hypothetical protein